MTPDPGTRVDTLLKIRYLRESIHAMPLKRIASMDPRGTMAQRQTDEFDRLEEEHPQGLSAAQIVEFFAPRGVKLAQATFRKYVQLGLLPRSRRIGEKGKHRGSRGLYPASAVRRISLLKALMDEGMTLEEIRGSFIFYRGQLDGVERSLDELFSALDKSIASKAEMKPSRRRELDRLVADCRKQAAEFVKDIERSVQQITVREPKES